MLKEHLPIESPTIKHLAGLLAETVLCVLYVPIDVIKERIQVNGHYKTTSQAFRKCTPKRVFGVLLSVRRHPRQPVPTPRYFGVLRAFERKERRHGAPRAVRWRRRRGRSVCHQPARSRQAAAAGSASGVAKSDGLIEFGYSNWLDGVAKIIRREGAATSFKGALFRVAFIAPMSTISMGLYEHFKFSLVS